MRRRGSIQVTGIVFVVLSLAMFISSQTVFSTSVSSLLHHITTPISIAFMNLQAVSPFSQKPDENLLATAQTQVENDEQNRELQALRDQFETEDGDASQLLPVRIVGYKGYIPGIREPSSLVINAGSNQDIQTGQAVVYENNLVGRISQVTSILSVVQLLSDSQLTFTAETLSNQAAGVIQGGQDTMIFGNVVLSETLEEGDMVVTKGDVSIDGQGFPPNIVVGQITATEKRQSDLFQLARVESLLSIPDLTTVFVYQFP